MSRHEDSTSSAVAAPALAAVAAQVAGGFFHRLVPAFRTPACLVCPSDEAERAVVEAMTQAAAARGIPVEVIDLRPAPAERLDAVTARLDGWRSRAVDDAPGAMPALLILRGLDIFGDDAHEGPTYPFRSHFQFDQKFLWLFIGRDASRMRFLFGNYRRPLYQAASDITPEDWGQQRHDQ